MLTMYSRRAGRVIPRDPSPERSCDDARDQFAVARCIINGMCIIGIIGAIAGLAVIVVRTITR